MYTVYVKKYTETEMKKHRNNVGENESVNYVLDTKIKVLYGILPMTLNLSPFFSLADGENPD